MFDIILEILSPVIAFVAGYVYREITLAHQIIKQKHKLQGELNVVNKGLEEAGIKEIMPLRHEIINGVHYFYTVNDNKFVGQGSSLREAAVHYSGVIGSGVLGCFSHTEDGTKYCFVNGECMEYVNE